MIPLFEKATALRSVSLFARLGADEILSLARLAEDVALGPGAPIFGEGEAGEALFVVVRGRVSVRRKDAVIALIGPGECFGEIALLDDKPRSATVTAVEPTELLRIERDDFLDMLSLYPSVVRALLAVLARRLRGDEAAAG